MLYKRSHTFCCLFSFVLWVKLLRIACCWCITSLFLLSDYSIVWTCRHLFIHSPVEAIGVSSSILAVINKTDMQFVYRSLHEHVFNSPWGPKSSIAGLCGKCVVLFSKRLPNCLPKRHTIYNSYQQCTCLSCSTSSLNFLITSLF